ncbi:hypothetical protein AURDEDRAFT_131456 [Auricularia subglabra TFB-10046 SS5]|nr:hypothetical protein AURDEDRAFT_131456 [Auricularia subglabra TFB-10046 SS5]
MSNRYHVPALDNIFVTAANAVRDVLKSYESCPLAYEAVMAEHAAAVTQLVYLLYDFSLLSERMPQDAIQSVTELALAAAELQRAVELFAEQSQDVDQSTLTASTKDFIVMQRATDEMVRHHARDLGPHTHKTFNPARHRHWVDYFDKSLICVRCSRVVGRVCSWDTPDKACSFCVASKAGCTVFVNGMETRAADVVTRAKIYFPDWVPVAKRRPAPRHLKPHEMLSDVSDDQMAARMAQLVAHFEGLQGAVTVESAAVNAALAKFLDIHTLDTEPAISALLLARQTGDNYTGRLDSQLRKALSMIAVHLHDSCSPPHLRLSKFFITNVPQHSDNNDEEEEEEDEFAGPEEEEEEQPVSLNRFDVPPRMNYNPNMPFWQGRDVPGLIPHRNPFEDNITLPPRSFKDLVEHSLTRMDPRIPPYTADNPNPVSSIDIVRVGLCGRTPVGNCEFRQNSRQLTLDPDPCPRVDPDQPGVAGRWDYDSAYGLSDDLPVETELTVFLRCNKTHSLVDRIRLPVLLGQDHPVTVAVPANYIPNVLLGTFPTHGAVYLMFPCLLPDAKQAVFPADLSPLLFDVLRQSLVDAGLWHASTIHADYNAWIRGGHENKGIPVVGTSLLRRFSDAIRSGCARVPEFTEAFFVTTIRGVKHHFNFFNLHHDSARLNSMMTPISQASQDHDRWFVDKAYELRVDGACLQLASDSNEALIGLICEGDAVVDPAEIRNIMRSRHFTPHKKAQVAAFQAFTLDTSNAAAFAETGVVNMVVYDDTKHFHYTTSKTKRTIYKPISPGDTLHEDRLRGKVGHMHEIVRQYGVVRGTAPPRPEDDFRVGLDNDDLARYDDTMEGALRIEVTVLLDRAVRTLRAFRPYVLAHMVYYVPAQTFWYEVPISISLQDFHIMRVSALTLVFENLLAQSEISRRKKGSLVLAIVACRMYDALFKAEDTGSTTQRVFKRCGRQVYRTPSLDDSDDEEEDPADLVPIGIRDGVFYVGEIIEDNDGAFRVSRGICNQWQLDDVAYQFGKNSPERFASAFKKSRAKRTAALAGADRNPTKRKTTAQDVMANANEAEVPILVHLPADWTAAERAYQLSLEDSEESEDDDDVNYKRRPRGKQSPAAPISS